MSWCTLTRTVIVGRSNTWRRSTPTSGASGTAVTEAVYRKELRPVLTDGAEAIGGIFTRHNFAV